MLERKTADKLHETKKLNQARPAANLGSILARYPRIQSTSPELYLLNYLKQLGSAKI